MKTTTFLENPLHSNNLYAILLAGGSGTRLWPLSRALLPKQLLSLSGEETLLQQTARRLLGQVDPSRIFTVTHEGHRFEVKGQLDVIHSDLILNILSEPSANNTLPAIAWAAMEIARKDPKAVAGVFPSDHAIRDEKKFQKTFAHAVEIASGGHLTTFGIRPTGPETGYGYIRAGTSLDHGHGFRVSAFVEKPDRETAVRYFENGGYFWNAGIFVFRIQDFLEELGRQEPGIFEAINRIVESGNDSKILKDVYSGIKKISIDYGIMEKAKNVAVVPASFDWNDLGSWEAIYQHLAKNKEQNATQGNILTHDTSSSLLISKKGLLATIGLKDMAIIQTDDAVLVSPRHRVQEVKSLVEQLKGRESPLVESHSTVNRPWGTYSILEEGLNHKIKRIVVNSGQKLSLQRHQKRAEHWVVVAGTAKITHGDREISLKTNESTFISPGTMHRLENPGTDPLVIIEVQTGSYLGEDDIERFEDVYGRIDETC